MRAMNGGFDNILEGFFITVAFGVLLIISLVLIFSWGVAIWRFGWRNAAKQMTKKTIWTFGIFVVIPLTINYALDVNNRMSPTRCHPSTSEDGKYKGVLCDRVVRIYSAETGEILAERTFEKPYDTGDLPTVGWDKYKNIAVFSNDDSQNIRLPPSWWDRALAHLP